MHAQFKVLNPGPATTVQDQGRLGYRKFGVPVSGVLDPFAAMVANRLVGNAENAALLEFTFSGPVLEVLEEAEIAVTGAEMAIMMDKTAVAGWRTQRVAAGSVIAIGQARAGCRGYLAVSGGFAVPMVMGSRSCYPGARLGGFHGRRLASCDVLSAGAAARPTGLWALSPERIPQYGSRITLRAIPGPQCDYFEEGLARFFAAEFTVTPQADRMGYRLQGPRILPREGTPGSIISEPSLPGSVQVPEDGQPIVLLVEQTVGGYSKIATVISSDIGTIAQATPGTRIRFERVDLATAHKIKAERQALLEALRSGRLLEEGGQCAKRCPPKGVTTQDMERLTSLLNGYLLQI